MSDGWVCVVHLFVLACVLNCSQMPCSITSDLAEGLSTLVVWYYVKQDCGWRMAFYCSTATAVIKWAASAASPRGFFQSVIKWAALASKKLFKKYEQLSF